MKYSTNGFIDCEYFVDGFHAAVITADGPWEAVFHFCGRFGYSPRDVRVEPKFRWPAGRYDCSVGDPRMSFFIN